MGRQRMMRFVIMVPRSLGERFDQMATTYDRSRSEICRVALVKGYQSALAWCRRSPLSLDQDLDDTPPPGGAGSGLDDRSSGSSASEPPHDRLVRLEAYADAVLELEPDSTAESLRPMLGAHAVGLGFASPEVGEVVEGVIARRFPEDVGGEGGGLDSVPDLD